MNVAVCDINADGSDFFRDADQASFDGQRHFALGTRVQLSAILAAAVLGAFSWRFNGHDPDWAGVASASAFGVAALVRAYLWQARPDRDWYAGRAAAESAKTLMWRFAAGAEPFPIVDSSDEAERLYIRRLTEVRRTLKDVVALPLPERKGEITAEMRSLRAATFERRKASYLHHRLQDQRNWYSTKARFNRRRARAWSLVMLGLEILGLTGAVLKAAGILEVDLLGVMSACVAAAAAWLEMRQHHALSTAYTVAAGELADAQSLGERVSDEAEWSSFVANAEEAISREHTMWVASRGG